MPNEAAYQMLSETEMVSLGIASSIDEAATIKRRTKHGHWEKGTSGNPSGRPKGLRNKLTSLREKFADAKGELVLNLLLQHAVNDSHAAMFLAERFFPGKDWTSGPVAGLGPLHTVEDCEAASDSLFAAYCAGEISLQQFDRLCELANRRSTQLETESKQAASPS